MNFQKTIIVLSLLALFSCNENKSVDVSQLTFAVPTAGNSWVINDVFQSSDIISKEGITNWTDPNQIVRTFFYVDKASVISFGINAKVTSGTSEIKVSFGNNSKKIKVTNSEFQNLYIGEYNAKTTGYHYIDIQGLNKDGTKFAEIKEVLLSNTLDDQSVKYIKDDFYFGRRGPSTHLVYKTPDEIEDIEWFYNEIEIPKDQDVIGSYFMANGFGEGYFGIQVNSPTERRILFSVWSPYKTDDPNSIPDEFKIKLLKKGKDVNSGEFGNEGSGGQSYKVYNWKSGTRYRFLTSAKPTIGNSTDYTAYFYDPEIGNWDLIASFRRPKTTTHLTRLYSFLENFIPNTGALPRYGGFYNQWIRDSNGQWYEIIEVKFSADATARKDARLDYSGGLKNQGFYLMNCGFTNDITEIGELFIRKKINVAPLIDFSALE